MAKYDGRIEELGEEIRRLERELEIAKQERRVKELKKEITGIVRERSRVIPICPWEPWPPYPCPPRNPWNPAITTWWTDTDMEGRRLPGHGRYPEY